MKENRRYYHHLRNRINEVLDVKDDSFLLQVLDYIRLLDGSRPYDIPGCGGIYPPIGDTYSPDDPHRKALEKIDVR